MQVVILAGGLGTRLRPLTDKIPKSLVEIRNRPFLDYQLQYLQKQDASEVLILAGYKAEMIQEFLSSHKYKMPVRLLNEGDSLRGTGGALHWANEQGALATEFCLTYGDSFLAIDYPQVWNEFQKSKASALMTVMKNAGAWDQSNVIFEKPLVKLYDKKMSPKPKEMKYIDYGFLALSRKLVENWTFSPPYDLAQPLKELSIEGQLHGFEVQQRFYEVGSLQGLKDFEIFLGTRQAQEIFDFIPRSK